MTLFATVEAASTWELLLVLIVSFILTRYIRSTYQAPKKPAASPQLTTRVIRGASVFQTTERTSEKIMVLSGAKFDHAVDLYNETKCLKGLSGGCNLDRVIKALSVAAIKAGKPESVFGFVRDWQAEQKDSKIPMSDLASAIIKACTARGFYRECLAMYDQLFEASNPDQQARSCLLFCAVESTEFWRAKKFFKEISAPTAKDHGNLIRAACARGDNKVALESYQQLDNPEAPAIASIVLGLLAADNLKDAEDILGRDGGRLDARAGNAVLQAIVGVKEKDKENLWNQQPKTNERNRVASDFIVNMNQLNLSEETLAALTISFAADLSRPQLPLLQTTSEASLTVIRNLIPLNFNLAITATSYHERTFGSVPREVIELLLQLCRNAGATEAFELFQLFTRTVDQNTMNDLQVIEKLVHSLVREERFDYVIEIMARTSTSFPIHLAVLVHLRTMNKQPWTAKVLFQITEMFKGSSEKVSELLQSYVGNFEAAAELLAAFLSCGAQVDDDVIRKLSEEALAAGEALTARRIYDLLRMYDRFLPCRKRK